MTMAGIDLYGSKLRSMTWCDLGSLNLLSRVIGLSLVMGRLI